MLLQVLLVTIGLLYLSKHTLALPECVAQKIPQPEYFGTEVLNIEAKEVHDYDQWNFIDHLNVPFERRPLSFCNITITYTHPGQNDKVNVYVWLPLENWNGRFFGQGGGGWAAGHDGALAPAVGLGYAAANTDSGHTFFPNRTEAVIHAGAWALASPGNVNWVLLQNFASRALDDMTHLAKSVTQNFYGKAPKYSYWNGCSTGGRQGLMLAQRYPKNYDGIVAAAPAVNFATFVVISYWGQLLMRKENYFPPTCEFEAIRKAAIEACDELDGVRDGVIAAPGLCKFDAQSVVGQRYDCHGDIRKISKSAANIVNAAWAGPKRNNKLEWFGETHETAMNGSPMLGGKLHTICDENNKNCRGASFPISRDWIALFLAKDPEYDASKMTEDEFWRILHQSRQQYTSIIDTSDPDLSGFRAAGGKMITWHGLADHLIYPNGSSHYYGRVLALDPKAQDFYRYFEAPGVSHCAGKGGVGAYPGKVLDSLIDWVENGNAPNHLDAATLPANKSEPVKYRPLCPYPLVAAYIGGPPDEASSFECAENFGTMRASFNEHSEL